MIAFVDGVVEEMGKDFVILNHNGMGYRIFTPSSVLEHLSNQNEIRLYTHFSVREDAMQLYGFLTREDVELYRLLLGVSGIGPKGAMGILSIMNGDEIRFAVLSEDANAFAKAPGVGKKTAQKVILELKDKVDLEEAFELKSSKVTKEEQNGSSSEAVMALTSLGYSGTEALKAVKKAESKLEDATVEDLIKAALKEMI